ncbi:unnamed protein product [Polarella glacialis]|uniref:Uncharacterized protein n=1 Tax=Polarella glacialis TaxID=89957 RepID=A0A813GSZ6_POLGL|nr:unnamed protein product [Polarella glacialis]
MMRAGSASTVCGWQIPSRMMTPQIRDHTDWAPRLNRSTLASAGGRAPSRGVSGMRLDAYMSSMAENIPSLPQIPGSPTARPPRLPTKRGNNGFVLNEDFLKAHGFWTD